MCRHNPENYTDSSQPDSYRWVKDLLKPLSIFTGMLVIVVALQTCILNRTDTTLNTTLETNRATQRAFIYPVLLQTFFSPDAFNAADNVNFLYALNNSGNTATKNLTIRMACAPAAQEFKDPWVLMQQYDTRSPRGLVAPHAGQTAGCSFKTEQIKQMIGGKLFGYILIEATYEDRVSVAAKRISQYAVELTQLSYVAASADGPIKTPAQFVSALTNIGEHNCADEECP